MTSGCEAGHAEESFLERSPRIHLGDERSIEENPGDARWTDVGHLNVDDERGGRGIRFVARSLPPRRNRIPRLFDQHPLGTKRQAPWNHRESCADWPEPSEVWRSADAGSAWEQTSRLETLSSSSEWSFPPRPDTHHVRWIACHPLESELSGSRSRQARWCPRSMVAALGATASLVDRGTLTSSPFTATLLIPCASRLAMDISRATTPA